MSLKINNILVPTDYSEYAEKALSFALEIANKTGSSITLMHVIEKPAEFDFQDKESEEYMKRNDEGRLQNLVEKIKKDTKGVSIEPLLELGNTVTSVLDTIHSSNYQLVVMGTKGKTGSGKILLGSITTHIIQKSNVPVLAVPRGSTLDNFNDITFTTDYKEGDLAALKDVTSLAELFGSSIDVVHIAEEQNLASEIRFRGYRELVRENIEYENMEFNLDYEYDFFPGIVDYMTDHHTSMLVMVRYQKTFWESLAERNHSKEMALYSKVPVMVMIGEEVAHKIDQD